MMCMHECGRAFVCAHGGYARVDARFEAFACALCPHWETSARPGRRHGGRGADELRGPELDLDSWSAPWARAQHEPPEMESKFASIFAIISEKIISCTGRSARKSGRYLFFVRVSLPGRSPGGKKQAAHGMHRLISCSANVTTKDQIAVTEIPALHFPENRNF